MASPISSTGTFGSPLAGAVTSPTRQRPTANSRASRSLTSAFQKGLDIPQMTRSILASVPPVPWDDIRRDIPSEVDSDVGPRIQAFAARVETFERRLNKVSEDAGAAVQESAAAAASMPAAAPGTVPENVRSMMRTANIKAVEPSQLNPASAIATDFLSRLKAGGLAGGGGSPAGATAAAGRSSSAAAAGSPADPAPPLSARGNSATTSTAVAALLSRASTSRRTSHTGSASGRPPLSPRGATSPSDAVAAFKAAVAASPRGSLRASSTSSTGGASSPTAEKAADLFAKYGVKQLTPRRGSASK